MKPAPYLWKSTSTGYYYVIFYEGQLDDRKRMQSLKTRDLSTAQDRLYLWKQQRAQEENLGIRHVGVPVGEARDEYLKHYEKRNKPSSCQRYKNALANVLDFVGADLPLGALQVKDLQNYQLYRDTLADSRTVDYEIDVMRAFLNWCKRRKWVHENVADSGHVERLVKDLHEDNEKRTFTDEELKILLSLQDGQDWQTYYQFATLYYTGMRIAELGHLTVKDVDLPKSEIQIREKRIRVPVWNAETRVNEVREVSWSPKSYEKRIVPIEARLAPILREFKERRTDNIYGLFFLSLHGNQVTDHLSRVIKRLTGKQDISAHTFRHTHISHALNRWGRHPSVVQKWVGHKDLQTTMQYIHVTIDDLHREAMKTGG